MKTSKVITNYIVNIAIFSPLAKHQKDLLLSMTEKNSKHSNDKITNQTEYSKEDRDKLRDGQNLIENEKYEEARKIMKKLIKKYQNIYDAYLDLITIFTSIKAKNNDEDNQNYIEAEKLWQTVLKLTKGKNAEFVAEYLEFLMNYKKLSNGKV